VNPLTKIVLYLLAVVLTAVVLAPPVFWGIAALGQAGFAFGLDGHPFHRVFSRITQIAALLYLWPLLRSLGTWRPADFGIQKNPRRFVDLGVGFLVAAIPVFLLGAAYLSADILRWRDSIAWETLARIVGTAAFVSVFEEVLFRVVLLGLAVKAFGKTVGLAAVSLAFSVVHFIRPKAAIAAADVNVFSGWDLVMASFDGAPRGAVLIGGVVTLLVIGWILGWATLRTRSLWLAIGLHAGWIFAQQTANLAMRYRVKPPDALMPWIGPAVVSGMVPTGLIPVAALLITWAVAWRFLRATRR